MRLSFVLLGLLIGLGVAAQETCYPMMPGTGDRLTKDIYYLASDELEGREPGSEGAMMAAQYIAETFAKLQLEPVTEKEYMQEFSISKEVLYNSKNNVLKVKSKKYSTPNDYFPLKYSSNGNVEAKTVFVGYGIKAKDLGYNDYKKHKGKDLKGKIFVMDISSPDGMHPHSKYIKYHELGERIDLAIKKGAVGIVLVNLGDGASDPRTKFRTIKSKGIPVVFVQNPKLAKKLKKGKKIRIQTDLKEHKIAAFNVVGFINNSAEKTVVIGAHYDHLGMGGESSLYAGSEAKVHYGADDNASGVAGLLELARNIRAKEDGFKRYNYAFVAFSGEEMGLLGSAYFVKHLPRQMRRIAYMLNMDMIGRMEESQVAINGVGTSPIWEKFVPENACNGLQIKTSESGVGPSDHTSFYYKEIPVLHFFTGTHKDYHKPSDVAENINFKGEARLLGFIMKLIMDAESAPDIPFTATTQESMDAPRFTVTLGVMPSYMYEGEGMKIDGVTEGKPASKAGMQAGDIVIKMNDIKVVDMMSYMKALSSFKKGDEVEVTFDRKGKVQKTQVQF